MLPKSLPNSAQSFGALTRLLHWLTALLIFSAIPLGLIANRLPYDTSAALAQKAQLFSLHKTIGIAAFIVAVCRILWALGQRSPAPLHPERRFETAVAATVHWLLYISLLAVPLSGWVHHAATSGFAPILWPLGQNFPLVPKSETIAVSAAALHWVFTKLLVLSILLHVAGALKHHLIDKDATLRRMISGVKVASSPGALPSKTLPAIAAVVIYLAGAGLALTLTAPPPPAQTPAQDSALQAPPETGNWQVTEGTLAISTRQLGSDIAGNFATWHADIRFDETAPDTDMGAVTVQIDTSSLTLGSVTAQAQSAEFLDSAQFGTAVFSARITKAAAGYVAKGTLTLHGVTMALDLPFTLTLSGDSAEMTAAVEIDRRDFGIGPKYPDEATVGFATQVTVQLKARRKDS